MFYQSNFLAATVSINVCLWSSDTLLHGVIITLCIGLDLWRANALPTIHIMSISWMRSV